MANCLSRSQTSNRSQSVKFKATSAATMTACRQNQTRSLHTMLDIPAHMDLCQIELIYRAEGNANLVLALPQFKKVLRLPKMQTTNKALEEVAVAIAAEIASAAAHLSAGNDNRSNIASVSTAADDLADEVGVVTMQNFMAYIEIIRRLLGNEFVCKADIVAIPKANDRIWINEHIKAARPVARLDKEFCGQFGLLLADATQLPATFDVLLSNLQVSLALSLFRAEQRTETPAPIVLLLSMATKIGDTYAIEIKPKQGWRLLPSDVNDLFDLMPTMTTEATTTTQAPSDVDSIKPKAGKRKWEEVGKVQSIQRAEATAASVSTTGTTRHLSSTKVPSSADTQPCSVCRCRYCSMQVLKLSVGKVNKVSAYCPMDLFSGLHDQMLHAVDALFVCPQNNLRIFQNGNLIYGDHEKSISWLELNSEIFQGDAMVLIKDLLVTCLLREYACDEGDIDVVSETEAATAGADADPGVSATITSNASADTITNVLETKNTKVDVFSDEAGKVTTAAAPAAAAESEANIAKEEVVVVEAVIGQPNETTTSANVAASVEAAASSQRITRTGGMAADSWKKETIPPSTTTARAESKAVPATKKQTETKTEAEALVTQAQINKAEILCLPKNCVLQKILHFQLLAKKNFDFMWKSGYATKSAKTYNALRSLLTQSLDAMSLKSLSPQEQYMLGATALDSSIMVTFQEIKMPNNKQQRNDDAAAATVKIDNGRGSLVYLSAYDKYFLTKVTLLDLDPKPDSHFHKYIKQSKEILNCLNLS